MEHPMGYFRSQPSQMTLVHEKQHERIETENRTNAEWKEAVLSVGERCRLWRFECEVTRC